MDTITIIPNLLKSNGSAQPVTVALTQNDIRLIAAAPDMLEALEDALWALDNMAALLDHKGVVSTLTDPRPSIRAVIAKAESRP